MYGYMRKDILILVYRLDNLIISVPVTESSGIWPKLTRVSNEPAPSKLQHTPVRLEYESFANKLTKGPKLRFTDNGF
jgi:hypothetical protein